MGREHCFERFDVERANCCLEVRNEITDGDRQSPEASDPAKCLSWNIYCNKSRQSGAKKATTWQRKSGSSLLIVLTSTTWI